MRKAVLAVALVAVGPVCIACSGAAGPTAPIATAPSASPTALPAPRLAADATALTNLAAVQAIEAGLRRPTHLVAISARVGRDGRLAGTDPWYYTYRDPGDVVAAFYQWRVDVEGNVTSDHLGSCGFSDRPMGVPAVDSDRAVRIALQAGGDALLSARGVTDARMGITYSGEQVRVVFHVSGCRPAFVILDAASGAVLFADFSCRGLSHGCIGPGVFQP